MGDRSTVGLIEPAGKETRMRIIRRKRTVTIETCSFRKWQDEGSEETFSCPNCGKTFESNPLLGAAIEKYLPEIVDEPKSVLALPEAREAESSCDKGCNEKTGGNHNHE